MQTTTANPQTHKPDVLVGIYHKGYLGHTEKYDDLKAANVAGRAYEQLGYKVIVRCGVSKLPEVYPYAE